MKNQGNQRHINEVNLEVEDVGKEEKYRIEPQQKRPEHKFKEQRRE